MRAVASENRRLALLLDSQRRVLERIADGAPLEEVLQTLVRLIEEHSGDMRCAVLLADSAQQRLRFVAAPNIPEDYRRGIEPYLRIAPDMGSCGTAAYTRQPVYTQDTASDGLWENCGGIAVRNGLRAIWSTPILSDANTVLGTFAMYYGSPRLPAEEHIQLIDMAIQLARVAIEARDGEILRGLMAGASDGILITDCAGNIVKVNQTFARMLSYAPAELQGKRVAQIAEEDGGAWAVQENPAPEGGETPGGRHYRRRDGTLVWMRERRDVRYDETGAPRYVVARVRRMADSAALERLSRREREVLELVVAGHTSKEIAARLDIAAASVDTYRGRIMDKLGTADLPALVRFAIRHGIASL